DQTSFRYRPAFQQQLLYYIKSDSVLQAFFKSIFQACCPTLKAMFSWPELEYTMFIILLQAFSTKNLYPHLFHSPGSIRGTLQTMHNLHIYYQTSTLSPSKS
ncbi:hypothetical protein, partial [Paenibacillus favisporus]|uniref:hypothetical protein n=1 Tax=Paenibacillus favisporus TaxID=221028 RepID=UPI003D2A3D4A